VNGVEIRIGTRGSTLALAQANTVAAAMAEHGARPLIVIVETEGDRRPPDTPWGEGVFVAAIERELIAGRIDAAVHSAKDLPTTADDRLRLAAYLPRADPRDALVIRNGFGTCLNDLPQGARVGTDSPRRTGFLLARRPDLTLRPLHGNVDTRLRRLEAGEADALVLAAAGLERLGLADRIAERLDPDDVPPAPGQGAIAVQVRSAEPIGDVVAQIDDQQTRQAVEAERAFLAACGGGCRSPIGALASIEAGVLSMQVGRVSVDGTNPRFGRRSGLIGRAPEMVSELAALVSTVGDGPVAGGPTVMAGRPRVIVTRPSHHGDALIWALGDLALEAIPVPAIAVVLAPAGGDLDEALRNVGGYGWVVVTSGNGARAMLAAAGRVLTPFDATRWAVIGSATREVLELEGVDVCFQPTVATSAAVARELPISAGERILVVRGTLGGDKLRTTLTERGGVVDEVVAYVTHEAPPSSRGLLRAAFDAGPIVAAIFTSSSTVRGLAALAVADGVDATRLAAICIGNETAATAAASGFDVIGVADASDPSTLAETAALAIRGLAATSSPAQPTGVSAR
jgi:hydroxymethylbilane synthase